ncbi:hypothetical protein Slin15195_G119180 [Septoria linicola]|uniref:Uncharacterized protein n=1 Tax=Septoria linicola TaxID=215465 RepID=A0A9Q9B0F5_9PEZI|nr:hypothetical protein Slin15195_G119180 [Septoria linicola]
MYKTLALALAAGAAAAPSSKPAPLSSLEFGLIMGVSNSTSGQKTFVSLNAAKNANEENYQLIGQRLSVYPGTPAFADSPTPDPDFRALELDIDGVSYGLFAEDIGHRSGARTQITANKSQKQYEWAINAQTGEISHKISSAVNQFLACNTTVNGEEYLSLAWGNYASEGLPEGCIHTSVYQNCNVPGSVAKCGSSESAWRVVFVVASTGIFRLV